MKLPEEGDRIRLINMPQDPCPIPPGTTGTVMWTAKLGDQHQIVMNWDNGRHLNLSVPPDTFEIID